MKNNLEIIKVDDKYALVDGFDTIKKGSKVINVTGSHVGLMRTALQNYASIGYIGHGGASFLYFREKIHRRFIKYITKQDLKKLIPTRKYKTNNWSNPNNIHG
jgi:hypothetical protein